METPMGLEKTSGHIRRSYQNKNLMECWAVALLRPALRALLLLIPLLLLLNSVSFSQNTSSSDLLDFILILDESGSMRVNDMEGIRVEAARMFIDLLHPDDRIAVVGFGNGSRVIAPLVKTDSGRSKLEDGLATVGKSKTKLPKNYEHYSMIGDALETADSILGQRTIIPRSVVLVFTDGEFQKDDIRPGIDLQKYLNQTYGAARELGDNGTIVVACAFTKAANLEVLSRIAREGGGFTEKVNNPGEIEDVFLKILKSLPGIGSDEIEQGVASKTINIDENVWQLALLAVKAKPDGPDVDITLTGPEGDKIEGEKIDGRLYSVLRVQHPSPGQYTATVPVENRLEVKIIMRVPVSLNIVSPRAGQRLVATGQTLQAVLSVHGGGQLKIEGEMVTPMGEVKTLSMVQDQAAEGDSLWRTEIHADQSGGYHVTFAAFGMEGSPLGAETILQFNAVPGIEGNVTIDPGFANIGSPINASATVLPGLPITAQMMIVKGPDGVDTVQMSQSNSQGSSREYSATYVPPPIAGIYDVDIALIFNSSGEDIVQHKSRQVPKIFRADSTAKCKLSDTKTGNFDINVEALETNAVLSMSPCSSDQLVHKPQKESWNLPKNKKTPISFSVSGKTELTGNLKVECSGMVKLESLGSFPVVLSIALTPSAPFKVPDWLWIIAAAVVIVIAFLIYCRFKPKFDKNISLFIESTGQEIIPAANQKFCQGAIYANKKVYLDAILGPKSLRLKSSGAGIVEMTVLDDIEGMLIDGEAVERGHTYRLFIPCEITLPSGQVRFNTVEIDYSDYEISERGADNE